jgi:hypothetical protein
LPEAGRPVRAEPIHSLDPELQGILEGGGNGHYQEKCIGVESCCVGAVGCGAGSRRRGEFAGDAGNSRKAAGLSIKPAALNDYFINLYQLVMKDPSISGLEIQIHWDTVNPNPPGTNGDYVWDYLDDAFD